MEKDNIIEINEWINAIDSLELSAAMIKKEYPLKWKWVLNGVHHCLYSICIASLRNVRKTAIKGRKNYDSAYIYQNKSGAWRKSRENKIDGAYGFYRISWNDIPEEKAIKEKDKFEKQNIGIQEKNIKKSEKHLIGFTTALARVMDDEHWMDSNAIYLTDDEIKNIGYIHNIRNLFEHFINSTIEFNITKIRISLSSFYKAIDHLMFEVHENPFPDDEGVIDIMKSSLYALKNDSDQI